MENQKDFMKELNNEIEINLTPQKDLILSICILLLVLGGGFSVAYLVGRFINATSTAWIVGLFIGHYTMQGLLWRFRGERKLVFDDKYIIFFNRIISKSSPQVFRLNKINKLSINKSYTNNFWRRVKSFWTQDGGGCIHFNYEGKVVKIGNGLTVDQAEKLVSELKEKQFLREENFS